MRLFVAKSDELLFDLGAKLDDLVPRARGKLAKRLYVFIILRDAVLIDVCAVDDLFCAE